MKLSSKLLTASQFIVKNPSVKQPFPPLPTVSELVRLYKVRATKQLSQNFLFDPKIIDRFLRCLTNRFDGYHVCEVGPGPGSITRGILQNGVEHLTVVEKDSRFLPILQYVADVVENRMTIVHGDILKYDISNAFPVRLAKDWHDDCPPFCVLGNLPFNISLPLLFQWLDLISRKEGMFKLGRIPFVLTFQSEVAERLISEPGGRQRSRLSVTAQYLCDITSHFTLPGGAFVPPPKVDVGVVKLIPKKEFDISLPFYTVDKVVKHLLSGHKQKPCKFGISTLFPPGRSDLVDEIFHLSAVPSGTRPIMLSNSHFRDFCYAYEEISTRIPQLKEVDTYDPKVWRKYFNSQGEPRDQPAGDTSDARNQLRDFLQIAETDDDNVISMVPSRRARKRANEKIRFSDLCDDT